jgi:ABC-type uncharacterized transport system ATPase subunit
MIGDAVVRPSAARATAPKSGVTREVAGLFAENDEGRASVTGLDLKVQAGEIVGIAGISGNGQSELVESLSGQRPIKLGLVLIRDRDFGPKRDHFDRFKVFGLPEEPLKSATVPRCRWRRTWRFAGSTNADDASWLLAVARADARHRSRPDQPLQCQSAVDRNADPRSFGRQ